jgi:hypothetical protein
LTQYGLSGSRNSMRISPIWEGIISISVIR